jgi:hypothetical protein
MRALAAALAMTAGTALAQDDAPSLACFAVALQIEYGLENDGIDGDPAEIWDAIARRDADFCLDWGGGRDRLAGLWSPDCAAVIAVMARGSIRGLSVQELDSVIANAVTGADPAACGAALGRLMPYGPADQD